MPATYSMIWVSLIEEMWPDSTFIIASVSHVSASPLKMLLPLAGLGANGVLAFNRASGGFQLGMLSGAERPTRGWPKTNPDITQKNTASRKENFFIRSPQSL